jgi:hypothetical protein
MPNKKSRKNPAPLVGSVIANPALFTKRLKGGEKVYFNVGQNAKVERSQTKPQYIIVTAPPEQPRKPRTPRPRPPAPPPPPPAQPAPQPPARPVTPRSAPVARAKAKPPKPHKKNRRPKSRPHSAGPRPAFPPFIRPSEQMRQNPLFGGRENPFGDMAKIAGEAVMVFVALGLGIPLVKRAILSVLNKPEVGPDGKPTILSHAIQAGLAAVAFGTAEKVVKDPTLKTLVQGAAVATAVAPAVNQIIEKVKPGSGLKLLGDPSDSAPISLNFNVDPLPLTEGLAADLQDLDTNPAVDRMLTEKAAEIGSPQLAPASEPLFRGLASPNLGAPQIAPAGEPLFRGLGEAEEKLLDPADTDPAGPSSIVTSEPLHLGALYIN